ncbi:hypothetical protein [Pontibacter chitinilyticus]|uniref:hypothetical protein n=1 Tax=Pontibacter chitinilyticus TaxID=2674989 RepID=UPI003219BEE8
MKKQYLVFFLLLFTRVVLAQENITVESNSIIKNVSNHPVGINVDYLMDDDSYLQPATSTTSALQQMGVSFLRFPGGEKSDNYIWGQYPYTTANPTLALTGGCHWPNEDPRFVLDDHKSLRATTLDFDEFMDMVHATGTQPLIVVNGDGHRNTGGTCGGVPSRDSLIMVARQWVRYANVTHHYGIKYWMIGNESYHSAAYNGAVTANDYLTDLLLFATAMKEEDPTIKIVANGSADSWWKTILSNPTAAGLIDYLGVSNYPIYNWSTGYDYYRTSTPNFVQDVKTASAAIDKYVVNATDRARIKVIATEFNTIDWSDTGWLNQNDVGHGLVAFDMLGQLLKQPKLDLAFFWNTRYVDNKEIPNNVFDALSSTGSLQANGQALSLWGKYLLSNLVSVNSTSNIVSYASKNGSELNVFLLNKDTAPHSVNLKLNDFNSTGKADVYTYQGTSTADTAPTLLHADSVAAIPGDASQYLIEAGPASITVLRFSKTTETPAQQVTSLTLINADNDQSLLTLTDSTVLNLAELPTRNFNIRANTNPTKVGSVTFDLSGTQTRGVTESMAPYALYGDDTKGDYFEWTPELGSYTLKATPYSASSGTGTAGAALTVNFTVTDQAPENNDTNSLITNIAASTGKRYTLAEMAVGVPMYTDRSYQITSVPGSLSGATLLQTANGDKWNADASLLSFDVSKDALVYVAYDPRATVLPAWLANWEKLSDQIGVNDSKISSMTVYVKRFPAGNVLVGGNQASPADGAENNYFILAKVAPISEALVTNLAATTSKAYTLASLQVGEKMYTDRTYQITLVPAPLEGASLIRTANDDKWSTSTALLSFELTKPATVYVAYDPRASALPSWLSGWTKLSEKIGVNDSKISAVNLYSKSFPAGVVTLGGNKASPAAGTENNYFVVVSQTALAATPVTPFVTNVVASSGKHYHLATLAVDTLLYTDRSYQITSVPTALQGASLIQPANDDKRDTSSVVLSFTVTQAATVYVAYDPRGTARPAWLADWEKQSIMLGVDDSNISSMELYRKSFAAGDVKLGGNMASPALGAQTNYLTIVMPSATATSLAASQQIASTLASEEQQPVLTVYPNPNTGSHIKVELQHFGQKEKVKITMQEVVSGQQVLSKEVYTTETGAMSFALPAEHNLKPGVYLIRAVAASGQAYARLLIIQ